MQLNLYSRLSWARTGQVFINSEYLDLWVSILIGNELATWSLLQYSSRFTVSYWSKLMVSKAAICNFRVASCFAEDCAPFWSLLHLPTETYQWPQNRLIKQKITILQYLITFFLFSYILSTKLRNSGFLFWDTWNWNNDKT